MDIGLASEISNVVLFVEVGNSDLVLWMVGLEW